MGAVHDGRRGHRTFILAKHDFNTDLPVYMGENSIGNLQPSGARPTSPRRLVAERYLKTYLMEMIRCMKEGVPIEGYLYWTLVDDVQPPRLGLYNYDFVNHRILDTDGFGQPSGEDLWASRRRFAERRQGDDLRRLRHRLSGRVGGALRLGADRGRHGAARSRHLRLGFQVRHDVDGGDRTDADDVDAVGDRGVSCPRSRCATLASSRRLHDDVPQEREHPRSRRRASR